MTDAEILRDMGMVGSPILGSGIGMQPSSGAEYNHDRKT